MGLSAMFASLLTSLLWFFVITVIVAAAVLYFCRALFQFSPPSIFKERIQLPNGQILEGPENTLGRGGFGVVAKYTLISSTSRTSVAVKKPNSAEDNDSQEHEIKMLQEAGSHSNIINLMVSARVGNKVYLVFELMQGTVKDLLKAYPKLSWPTKLSVVTQLLQGLVHLHALTNGMFTRKSLVHQDLKPQNLLVNKLEDSRDIQVKICDFGMARMVDEIKMPFLGRIALSRKGPAGGTYEYMPPEVVKMLDSQQDAGCMRESDVFSTGMIMWEIVTGQAPHRSKNDKREGIFPAFKRDQEHRPTTQKTSMWGSTKTVMGKPDYPRSGFFGPIIAQCIETEPSKRPSATKVLDAVKRIQPP